MSESDQRAAKNKFRTPLKIARGLGSGKSGTGHFWYQRVTAVALAILLPWLLGTLISLVGADYLMVVSVIAKPLNAILLSLFVIALFWHAKLGMQVVIEDYVHTRVFEVLLQLLITFLCTAGAATALFAIIRIAL